MTIATLGLDLGKAAVHVIGLDATGRIVLQRRITRSALLKQTGQMPRCVIGLEACCGAHHLGRRLSEQGHDVRLMPPQYVRPYVKSNKNDYRDAEAAAEAAGRPTMRFVPLKSERQLDLQSLHRLRDSLIGRRTALINQMRALLFERGLTVSKGRRNLEQRLPEIRADETPTLSPRMREVLQEMRSEWRTLDERIKALDAEFVATARQEATCRRLVEIPGIGPTIATALVAAVGNGAAFTKGRDMAAWLGLVPRQRSTGSIPKLLGISKRGNKTCVSSSFTERARPCRTWCSDRTLWDAGWLGCKHERIETSSSWRSRTNWHGLRGRS